MEKLTYQEVMADPQAAADFARYRASIYRLASSVFADNVTEESLARLIAVAREATEDTCVRACEAVLFSNIRAYDGADLPALRTKVATEYAELFVGPRPPLAPCYESMYLGANPRLFADVTMRVRAAYKEQGFEVGKRNHVPDDHIGYELAFMGAMCDREADAHEAGDAAAATSCQVAESNFLSVHLGVWAGLFASRVSAAWCADYYNAWARFVEAFVEDDMAFLRGCADNPVSAGEEA